jgi:uncharacterized protein
MMLNRFLNHPIYLLILLPMLWGCSSLALSPTTVPVKNNPMPPVQTLGQNLPITAKIVVQKKIIALEVASTPREQMIGLMSRRSMPIDQGMLFEFSQPQPAQFWMKNTLIPLDMLFLNKGTIKNIQANVPPCKADPCPSYGPKSDVLIDQVIELNAGRAATLGLKVGDKLLVQRVRVVEPKRP